MKVMLTSVAAATLLCLVCQGASATTYQLTVLDSPSGVQSFATGINAAGQVVGHYYTPGFTPSYTLPQSYQAAVWTQGVRTDLQPLPSLTNYTSTTAWDINDSGHILGQANYVTWFDGYYSDIESAPVIWQAGGSAPTNLSPLPSGQFYSDVRISAGALNNQGTVAAVSDIVATTTFRASVIDGAGQLQVLGPNNVYSEANDINDAGTLAGSYDFHAAVWQQGQLSVLSDEAYGQSEANAINQLGVVGGVVIDAQNQSYTNHAALWIDGELNLLPTLTSRHSRVLGLNNLGQAVGYYEGDDLLFHAALWDGDSVIDLSDALGPNSTFSLVEARDINDAGQIVGWGRSKEDGIARAFLITPVPEPATWASMMLGLGALMVMARNRRSQG